MITRGAERSRLSLVLVITAVFMVAEVVGGVLSNSLALLADAGHMFTDTAALALALFAMRLAMRPPSPAKTYGYVRLEVLAALVNGAALLVIAIFILREAYQRILSTREVDAPLMLGVAFLGLLVNLVGALLLRGHAGENLNLRGAYLHVLGDLLGSLGTILAGVIILSTGWHPADPVISILIAVLILVSAWRLVREATDVLLEAAPRDVDVENLLSELSTIPGLHDVHDLHVWTLTSGFVALSGHGIIDDPLSQAEILAVIRRSMARRGIEHVTFQLELRPLYQIPDPERGGGLENADE
jgi:cobalt-zinc-cadmium efflux system protein